MKITHFQSTILLPAWVLLGSDTAHAALRLKGMNTRQPPPQLHDHDPKKKEDKDKEPKDKDRIDGDCPPPPPPGPPKPNNDGTYAEGVNRGVHEAGKIWHESGCDCVNIWGYQAEVEEMLDANFGDVDSDTDRQIDYKRGVRKGAKAIVDEHERECLDESPDECNDLGEAAAMEIAFDYCPINVASATGFEDEPDYKQNCREVAYGVCKGAMLGMVKSNGCENIPTSDLAVLQEECVGQIDAMTPDGEDDTVYEVYFTTDLPVAEI